jgi:threonine/homoserine/homoserine lactone efflux protein
VNTHLLGPYVAAVFLAMIAPGPDMLFVLASGERGGPRAGLLAPLGVVSSEVVQITAVAAGPAGTGCGRRNGHAGAGWPAGPGAVS